jgi:hypothetical protein
MIITQANALVGEVHDRMPVILETGDVDAWLTGGAGTPQGGAKLEQTLLVNKGKLVSRSLAISAPADTKQPPQLGNRRLTFPRRRAVNQIAIRTAMYARSWRPGSSCHGPAPDAGITCAHPRPIATNVKKGETR